MKPRFARRSSVSVSRFSHSKTQLRGCTMNHIARLYHIIYINPPPEILAQQLGYGIWTLCSAFRYGDLVLLNDSECDKDAQEYAVIRIDDLDALDGGLLIGTQIETLAVSHLN